MRFKVAVALGLLLLGCRTELHSLDEAERWFRTGRFVDARARYVDLSVSRNPRVQVLALVGAARTADRLHDHRDARRLLEQAVTLAEVPGASAEAYLEYAEHLRGDGERDLALNYYYRAARASSDRKDSYIYQHAVTAIAALSVQ